VNADMDDLLTWLLGAMVEILLEIAGEVIIASLYRAAKQAITVFPIISPVLATIGYIVLGIAIGGISVLAFPHPFVPPSRIHGISLLISPVITGLVMSQIGSVLRRYGKQPAQIESFGYGFAFALGMALIRFIFVR